MRAGTIANTLVAAALLAGTALAATKDISPKSPTDDVIAKEARHAILMYPHYSLWDQVGLLVRDGNVELNGAVTQSMKKKDLGRIVGAIPGVTGVTNEIKVLPDSPMDIRLRRQVARAIFSEPSLSRYSAGSLPAIHILVDNGHVTLGGVVATEGDKDLAGIRAGGAGLSFGSIVNNLEVENPPKKS